MCTTKLMDKEVGCHLYTDDHAIISTSPSGLQNSFHGLNSYSEKWKLEAKLAKSQIICLCKYGTADKNTFTFNDKKKENVHNYCYLGIEQSSSGSFN